MDPAAEVTIDRHWILLSLACRRGPDDVMPWEAAGRELDDLDAIDDPTDIDLARRDFLRSLRAKGAIQ